MVQVKIKTAELPAVLHAYTIKSICPTITKTGSDYCSYFLILKLRQALPDEARHNIKRNRQSAQNSFNRWYKSLGCRLKSVCQIIYQLILHFIGFIIAFSCYLDK